MQQLTFLEAGKVEWRDVPAPELQGDGEAIVRPVTVATCDLDTALLHGRAPYKGPFALGHEGVAEGAGSIALSAVGLALASGASRVVYADPDPARLTLAERLGAEPAEGYPKRLGPFPVTVDSSASHEGLGLALRSTAPDGECTS